MKWSLSRGQGRKDVWADGTAQAKAWRYEGARGVLDRGRRSGSGRWVCGRMQGSKGIGGSGVNWTGEVGRGHHRWDFIQWTS